MHRSSRRREAPSERRGAGRGDPGAEVLGRLHARLGRAFRDRPRPGRAALAAFVFVNGFVAIALLSALAMITRTPFVFPSLGPTAFVLYFQPRTVAASPRNSVLGHAVGLACGYGALWATGLAHAGPATVVGVTVPRVFAAALAMGATGALLILFHVVHAPAGATTLIVALGIITRPRDLVVIEVAVVMLVAMAFVVNRLAGVPYPLWRAPEDPQT